MVFLDTYKLPGGGMAQAIAQCHPVADRQPDNADVMRRIFSQRHWRTRGERTFGEKGRPDRGYDGRVISMLHH
jgi:hypothetical protein